MLNKIKKSKKGFTLTEMIVVLVIIVILIALLVPTLVGYIDKAKEKSVMAEGKMVLTAAQTVVSERYGESKKLESADAATPGTVTYADITNATTENDQGAIAKLAEMPANGKIVKLEIKDYKVISIEYSDGGKTANYTSAGWTVGKTTTTTP